MPIKNFFSGRKPEENEVQKPSVADENEFGQDFGGMQSLDLYADEDSAAGGFAALLQPEDEFAVQDGGEVYYDDNPSLVVGDDQYASGNVGETVYQNLFAEDNAQADDFFAPQTPDYTQGGDDFFAAQPMDETATGDDFFAMQPMDDAQPAAQGDDFFAPQTVQSMEPAPQGDEFFAAQPADFDAANTQQINDFFAAQPEEPQPFADATYTDAQQPVDSAYDAAPVFDFDAQLPTEPQEQAVPFDIAVPEQTQSFEQPLEEETDTTDAEYMPKRKFAPVFTQPVPSALDELRAGIVRPASPISSIAATQVPVVVTAAEAAAAEAAAKEEAEAMATRAAEEEAAAQAAAERAAAEAEASRFGYEDPSPAEMGFGYAAPVQEGAYGVDNAENGLISADEFHLPVTEDAPEWQETAPQEFAPQEFAPQEFAPQADAFAANDAYALQDEYAAPQQDVQTAPAFFDYESAPIESAGTAEAPASFAFDPAPLEQDNVNAFYADAPEQATAQTPADYANNLQAMFSGDDTYAAVDAMDQQAYGEAPEQSFDTETFDAPAFADAEFMPQDDGAMADYNFADDSGDSYAAMPEADGFAPEYQDQTNAFGDMGDDGFGEFAPDGLEETGDNAPAFNPFQSEEWLDEGDYEEKAPRAGRKTHGGGDGPRPIKSKQVKSGGGGGGGKNNLPLIIVLAVLVVAIVCVALFLLLGGKGKTPPQSSSIASTSTAPSVSSEPPMSSAPPVDPIPRDEWYLKLVNRQNVLTADFKVEAKNCSDGIPVDTRIVEDLNKMIADGNATGLKLMVASGYRTYERQKTNYEYQVGQQVAAGKSQADAETAAAVITAPPGASEHNLGLAVDIMAKNFTEYDTKYAETSEAKWLLENAANYGFILRYPQTAQAVTGFEYEPWHYRYVGVEQAKKIKESGLTLEEYLAQDAPTGIPDAAGTAADSTAQEGAGSSSSSASSSSEQAGSSSSSAAQ